MKKIGLCALVACGGMMIAAPLALAQDAAFGSEEDTAYATALWEAMQSVGLAGDGALQARPYEGQEPHGAILETMRTSLDVEGEQGTLILKRNYMGDDVSVGAVWDDPVAYLDSVTVMFESASSQGEWFWAKYGPDGALDKTPDGVSMAGQVAGCIGCHEGAGGDDMIFAND